MNRGQEYKKAFLLSAVVLLGTTVASDAAFTAADLEGMITKKVNDLSASERNSSTLKQLLCEKGDIGKLGGIGAKLKGLFQSASEKQAEEAKEKEEATRAITLRSLDGLLCHSKSFAALGMVVCKGYPGFAESHCAKNAASALGKEDPEAVLKAAIGNKSSSLHGLLCKLVSVLPASISKFAASSCK